MALIEFRLSGTLQWMIILVLLCFSEAEDETANLSGLMRKTSETNVFNFVRLIVMRMVFGFANMFGFGDFLEDFAGGIFAPPEPEYGGFDYGDDDYKEYDDYDY